MEMFKIAVVALVAAFFVSPVYAGVQTVITKNNYKLDLHLKPDGTFFTTSDTYSRNFAGTYSLKRGVIEVIWGDNQDKECFSHGHSTPCQ